ncbi:MAG: iron-containing alcohol dehydrogenase [Synergistaceae bacterium]|jgi:4-hydroxybutyrate dehydrogenase|nr:iron-containing alcohol dehydrogenase [Synergistaceae bacterium]
MSFFVKTTISKSYSFQDFLRQWRIGNEDLLISSQRIAKAVFTEEPLSCDVLYQDREGEPDDEMVDAMLEAIDENETKNGRAYKHIVAVGGSTIIGISKLLVFGSKLRCEEIFNKRAELPRKCKLLAVPTTCGIDGEVTDTTTIAVGKQQTKRELSAPALFPDEAILIGDLLRTLPYEVFVTNSIDALSHAMEAYISPNSTLFTRTVVESAIERLLTGYKKLAETGGVKAEIVSDDLQSFLTASTMVGMVAGNAGLVHALSHPISATCNVPHRKANYLIFEEVFATYRRLNADTSSLEAMLRTLLSCGQRDVTGSDVWKSLFGLLACVSPRQTLREFGVNEAGCREMARWTVREGQRFLSDNPLPISQEVIEDIYRNCI